MAEWHDFFLMVGGGAAALAGLVFVAMSLNLEVVVHDPTHRNRAIGTLAGFTAAFMMCSFALLSEQGYRALGIEWLLVSAVAAYIYVNGYVRAVQTGGSRAGLSLARTIGGATCYAAEILGSILLILGYSGGVIITAVAMVIFFAFMISGAWLLIVGAHQTHHERRH